MSDAFQTIFERLRPLFARYEGDCVVLKDEAGVYLLGTHEVRAKDGYRTWLGGVEIKKAYVSCHLMPVYFHHALLDDVDPALLKRMQGKSCFNFKTADDALFAELDRLIERGVAAFRTDGRL
ncbi:hypothetical protein H8M03_09395 [Sphingomonas sabuli]|uniref:DUF1801 domain-containing protein n=1 Tax=Sphingomonas sabuli TaxID=2764186 RepID=A0A7G9L0T3_9SPHN|nr:hypothetical protein [Sphingomonas sabuli]QNM82232.1 hypothetical protein H8M03_09395 [Sphingomonas sabuli]